MQGLGEEAGIQQVQDRVLHAAHVLVHWQPAAQGLGVEDAGVVVRGRVAEHVPGRVHERVHGVGVPSRGAAALRAVHLDPRRRRGQGRLALRGELLALEVGRQGDRQLVLRHEHLAAVRAVDHGDRGAPEALTGEQPVAQPVRGGAPAGAALRHDLDGPRDGRGLVQAVELAGVHQDALAGRRDAGDRRVLLAGVQHGPHGQAHGAGEVEVALVVGRHGHDGARAVVGQHVVRGPDRQTFTGQRVHGVAAQEHAALRAVRGLAVDVRDLLQVLAVRLEFGPHVVAGELGGQRRVGRDHHEGRAVQRVRPGGEDRDDGAVLDLEVDVGALGAADPVALHGEHALGPVPGELVHVVQQGVRVLGDAEVPLVQGPLGDLGAATLAAAVHDLLVGEHRLVLGAPVDRGVLPVRQALAVQLLEQPLGPPVVLGVRGVQLTGPVHGDAVPLEGALLRLDVRVGPLGRVGVALDGGVLGRQAEGVPADGVQHVEAALHPVARDDVAHRERLGVPHVQVARRVREHVDHGAGLGAVLARGERPGLLPVPGPAGLHVTERVLRVGGDAGGGRHGAVGGLAHGGSSPHAVGMGRRPSGGADGAGGTAGHPILRRRRPGPAAGPLRDAVPGRAGAFRRSGCRLPDARARRRDRDAPRRG